jgi:hypothetical protein
MADSEKLFRDFQAEHRAGGEANPRTYLDQLEGIDRAELSALIDAYLDRSLGKPWDAAAFAGSQAERVRDEIVGGWELESGADAQSWRELLPALRNRAQVMRREVVARLAEGIGHPDEAARVGVYYHQMEMGQLPAEGVSNRVLEVLAAILGESAEKLRAAGSVVEPGGPTQADALHKIAFARTAAQDARYAAPAPASADESLADAIEEPDQSEVDRLFTGGPGAG